MGALHGHGHEMEEAHGNHSHVRMRDQDVEERPWRLGQLRMGKDGRDAARMGKRVHVEHSPGRGGEVRECPLAQKNGECKGRTENRRVMRRWGLCFIRTALL